MFGRTRLKKELAAARKALIAHREKSAEYLELVALKTGFRWVSPSGKSFCWALRWEDVLPYIGQRTPEKPGQEWACGTLKKPHAHRDPRYRKYIRSLPCAECGHYGSKRDPIVAAHLRCLGDGGTGIKPSDYYAVPLHEKKCHRAVKHQKGAEALSFDPAKEVIKCLIGYFVGGKP